MIMATTAPACRVLALALYRIFMGCLRRRPPSLWLRVVPRGLSLRSVSVSASVCGHTQHMKMKMKHNHNRKYSNSSTTTNMNTTTANPNPRTHDT